MLTAIMQVSEKL